MKIEELKPFIEEDISCGDPLYSLNEIKEKYKEVLKINHNSWMALDSSSYFDDEKSFNSCSLDFALFHFVLSDVDESNTKVSIVYHGYGPTGSLRELRHIYWGPRSDGYTFYLPVDDVIESFKILKKYFDCD